MPHTIANTSSGQMFSVTLYEDQKGHKIINFEALDSNFNKTGLDYSVWLKDFMSHSNTQNFVCNAIHPEHDLDTTFVRDMKRFVARFNQP